MRIIIGSRARDSGNLASPDLSFLIRSHARYIGHVVEFLLHMGHGTKSSVSVSHALQPDDRGSFGLRQDGVHHQVTVGSSRPLRDPARTHPLLLRVLARWVPAHEAAGRAFSRRYSRFGTLTRVLT